MHTVTLGAPAATWSGGALTNLTSTAGSALTAALGSALSYTLGDSTHTGGGSVALAFSAADRAFDFLAMGETLTVAYVVSIADGHGGAARQTVTFVVTGANDGVFNTTTVGAAAGAIVETTGLTGAATLDGVGGLLSFTDADLRDTHTVSQGAPSFSWSAGPLTPAQTSALTTAGALALTRNDSTGTGAGSVAWTYTIADSAADFLAQGETLSVTYPVTVADGRGGSMVQPVMVTITAPTTARCSPPMRSPSTPWPRSPQSRRVPRSRPPPPR